MGAQICNVASRSKAPKGPQRPGKYLLTKSDVIAAVAWRLDGIPDTEVATLTKILLPFAGNFREARPKVARLLADMRRPGDRRGAWSLACACLAREAERRGDIYLFAATVAEVVKSMQQAGRGKHSNRKVRPAADALDDLIMDYRHECPDLSPNALFDLVAQSTTSDVLVEFDQDQDELVCQLDPGDDKLTNVDRVEFGRRVHRAR